MEIVLASGDNQSVCENLDKVVGINKQETKKMRKNRKDLSKSNRPLKQLKRHQGCVELCLDLL